jgi:hypothetical protein
VWHAGLLGGGRKPADDQPAGCGFAVLMLHFFCWLQGGQNLLHAALLCLNASMFVLLRPRPLAAGNYE